jgi:hypothetical protein
VIGLGLRLTLHGGKEAAVRLAVTTAALERARTALEVALPNQQQVPSTFSEIDASSRRLIAELQQLTSVVIVASPIIAGCSLAVSVTAGISDRKRAFSLLRLTGAPPARAPRDGRNE